MARITKSIKLKQPEIIPSLIRCPGSIYKKIDILNSASCDRVHVDISVRKKMSAFRISNINTLKQKLIPRIDFHIFENNINIIKKIKPRIGDTIFLHVSPKTKVIHIKHLINEIKKSKNKVGLVFDCKNSITKILSYPVKVDSVMIMGIQMGKKKMEINPKTISTLKALRKKVMDKKFNLGIDGGVNSKTYNKLIRLCNFIVVGNLLFNSKKVNQRLKILQKKAETVSVS